MYFLKERNLSPSQGGAMAEALKQPVSVNQQSFLNRNQILSNGGS